MSILPQITSTSTSTSDALVPTAVSILLSLRRRSRWSSLKSLLLPSISPSQSSSILLHLRHHPHLALRFFLFTLHLSLCHHTPSSFSTIIHILARSRLRSPALSLLRTALRTHPSAPLLQTLARSYRPCGSAPFVFDLLILAHLHSHNLHAALSVLPSLRSPQTSTANALLRAAANRLGSIAAVHLYRDLVQTFRPNSYTFNTLLLALYRDARTDLNAEIMAEMDRFECVANAYTYSIRMAGCCDVAEARKLWKEMKEKGIKPDATAYNTLIEKYCECGEVGKGEEVYCEMVMGGLETTTTTTEMLIRGYCRVGDVGAAMRLYEDMRRKGIRAEAETVDEMVEEMCGKGMVDEGFRVLRGEMGMGSRRSYEGVIKGFCEAGRMEEAAELQAEMAGKGLEAGVGVYEAFICGYEKVGEFEMAERLREEMIRLQIGGEDR